jgi:flavin-dependent dehydrogenase
VILIAGGGVAGAAAAALLARAGRHVTVFERTRGPHDKLCGEFISIEAQAMLQELGVDISDAAPIERLRLCAGRSAAEAPLPFRGASFSRRLLDERVLARAAEAGAEIRRGIAVRAIAPDALMLADGSRVAGEAIVLASGKHDLRGAGRPAGRAIAFKMHFAPAPAALMNTVEIHLFAGGYAGLEPIEAGAMNLCFVVDRAVFAKWGRRWTRVLDLCPLLAERLSGATPRWPKPLSVASVPYGFLYRGSAPWFRVGDQLAVIPSFAGDGIAMALHGARRAAAAILSGETPSAFHAGLSGELAPQMRRANILARLLAWRQSAVTAMRMLPCLATRAARATRLPAA